MGVAITIFTYFGDDEETLSARFYGVKKAFCEAFKIVQQKMDLKNYRITLKIFSIQNNGLQIHGIYGHLCEI